MVTVALLYIYTILQVLMWVFFWLKCVKLTTFYILHNFTTSDVVALKKIYGEHCKQIIILYILDDYTSLKILAHLVVLPTTIMFTVSSSYSKISSTLAWFVGLDLFLNTLVKIL